MPKKVRINRKSNTPKVKLTEGNKKEKKVKTRERVLRAATEVFALHGYEAASIREMSEMAGANSASISYYFGGKESLYKTVVQTSLQPIIMVLDDIEDEAILPGEKVHMYISAVERLHRENPALSQLIYAEMIQPSDICQEVMTPIFARIYRVLMATVQQGMEQGTFRKDIKPLHAVLAMAGMINFYFIFKPLRELALPDSIEGDSGEYREAILQIFMSGILAE